MTFIQQEKGESYQEGEITFFFGVHLTQPIQIDFQSKTGVSKTKSVTLKSTRNTSVFGEILNLRFLRHRFSPKYMETNIAGTSKQSDKYLTLNIKGG